MSVDNAAGPIGPRQLRENLKDLKLRIDQLIEVNNTDLERRRKAEHERDAIGMVLTRFLASYPAISDQLGLLLQVKREWSISVFGVDYSTSALLRHILKEIAEVSDDPDDTTEWVDIILLAMDGYWRANDRTSRPQNLMRDLAAKVEENRSRNWEVGKPGEPIEHKREH